ncbi:MAG: hypothetical protein R6W90_16535 [Ignavibacteriaceae bacterium]
MKTETTEEIGIKSELSGTELERDVYVKRFRSFAKEYFEVELTNNIEPTKKVKETSRLLSFSLPANLNEIFLRIEESYMLWVLDTPLNNYLEDYFKLHFSKSSGQELLRTANESYQKWVFNRATSEKKYFASSFINLADKKHTNNFWFHLLLASVYMNEKSLVNYSKSFELLEKAREIALQGKLNDANKDSLLYYINLLSGFALLMQNDILNANDKFTEAVRINPFGITGKFYLALSELRLNHREVVQHLLKEIMNYDNFRCQHAINVNSAGMLQYFIHHPVSQHMFYYEDFSAITDLIEEELLDIKRGFNESYSKLNERLQKLEDMKVLEYVTEETSKTISFLKLVMTSLGKNKSVIFLKVYPDIEAKFNYAISNIKEAISKKYNAEVQEKLIVFNARIQEKFGELELVKAEQAAYIEKLKERLKESVDAIESGAAIQISEIEKNLNNINNIPRLNPRHSFSKAMIYNVIVSGLVFMLGGCTGYTDSFMYNAWEFKDVIGMVIIAGLKWSGISFLSGILIAFFVAAYVVVERSNERQKLVRRISFIKEEKEKQLSLLNKDYEATEKSIISNYAKKMALLNEEIEIFVKDKEKEEKNYRKEADEKIEHEVKKLEEIE